MAKNKANSFNKEVSYRRKKQLYFSPILFISPGLPELHLHIHSRAFLYKKEGSGQMTRAHDMRERAGEAEASK